MVEKYRDRGVVGEAGMGGRAEGGMGNSLQWREVTSECTDVKSDREDSRLFRALGDIDECFVVSVLG